MVFSSKIPRAATLLKAYKSSTLPFQTSGIGLVVAPPRLAQKSRSQSAKRILVKSPSAKPSLALGRPKFLPTLS